MSDERGVSFARDGIFAQIPNWLIAEVKPTSVVVFLALYTFADSTTGEAWPRVDTIAARAGVSESTTKSALKELEMAGAIRRERRYTASHVRTTDRYTVVRGHESRLPKTLGVDSDSKGGTKLAPEGGTKLAPEGGTKPGPKLEPLELQPEELDKRAATIVAPPPDLDADFEKFWALTVRKTDKKKARRAFLKALTRTDLPTLAWAWTEANRAWTTWPDTERSYVPHPSTWLNNDRWEDTPPAPHTRPVGKSEETLALAHSMTDAGWAALKAAMNDDSPQITSGRGRLTA